MSSLFCCCCCCQKDDDISLHQEARMHGNHDQNHWSHRDQNQHYDQEAKAWWNSTDSARVPIIPIHHGDGEANSASKVEEQRKNKLDVAAKAVAWEGHTHAAVNNEPQAKKEGTKSGQTTNDLFSDYIHQAKMKIRSMTLGGGKNAYNADDVHKTQKKNACNADDVHKTQKKNACNADDVHNTQKENHFKDTFSEYINRTKMKIRKRSGVGIGNSPSKKE